MGVSPVWTEMLRRKRNVSDALLYNGTSLAYALISFPRSKNSSDHVISPNIHFVLRRDVTVLAKQLLQMSPLVSVRLVCFAACYFYRPAWRESVGVIITAFILIKCSEVFVVSLLSFCTSITSPIY